MFRRTLLVFLLLNVIKTAGFTQETHKTYTYLGVKGGAIFNSGLGQFNQRLEALGEQTIQTVVPYIEIQGYIPFYEFSLGMGISIPYYHENEVEPPNTNILLNLYSVNFSLGYNLLGENKKNRLELFTGLGFTTGSVKVTTHNTVPSFEQILNGSQNVYEADGDGSFLLVPGIRFSKLFFNEGISTGLNLSVEYHLHSKDMVWAAPNFPTIRPNGFITTIGFVAGLRSR